MIIETEEEYKIFDYISHSYTPIGWDKDEWTKFQDISRDACRKYILERK